MGVFAIPVDAERTVNAVVHDHAPRLHATVSPHQFVNTDQARHRNDGGEVRVAKSGGLPWRGAVVRFPNHADLAVRPWLGTQPRHGCIDASLFIGAHQIHAVVRFSGAKHRDLGHAVAMRNVVFYEHFSKPICGCQGVYVAVVVIGSYLGDDRHLT